MDDATKAAIEKLEFMLNHAVLQQQMTNNTETCVTFVLPHRGRLFGKRGPRGEVVCENSKGNYVMAFVASDVVKSCMGLIRELKGEQ